MASLELPPLTLTSPAVPLSSRMASITGTSGNCGVGRTSKLTGSLALPAGSLATTFSVVSLYCGGVRATENCPCALVTAVPNTTLPGPVTVMVEPGSAVPVSGVPPETTSLTTGASGASVSTTTLTGPLSLVLPAASRATTVMVCVLSDSVVPTGSGKVHCPCSLTCTSPRGLPSTETVTVLNGSPVPLRVGVLLFTYSVPLVSVLSEISSSCGLPGGTVSMVKVKSLPALLTFPAASTAATVRVVAPSFSAAVVMDQLPLLTSPRPTSTPLL